MKTGIFLLLAFLFAHPSMAQRPWKEYLVPGTLMLFSGMVDGTTEALVFHYDNGFKRTFPNANNQFWNPKVSWKNKYKNMDPAQGPRFMGSTNVFVSMTDGYHLTRTTKLILDMGAITYCANNNHPEKTKHKFINWKTVVQDFLVLSAIQTIGFHITYSMAFRLPDEQQK